MAWRRDNLGPGAPESPPEWPDFAPAAPESNGAAPASEPAATPEASGSTAWMPPLDDGSCPPDHKIKAKDSSGIFHVPGGRFYDRTKPDRCYASEASAEGDGYRRSKS